MNDALPSAGLRVASGVRSRDALRGAPALVARFHESRLSTARRLRALFLRDHEPRCDRGPTSALLCVFAPNDQPAHQSVGSEFIKVCTANAINAAAPR